MGMESRVIGNLLSNPEQRHVDTKDGRVKITEIRVMADAYKRDGEGNLVQDDKRTEPVQVTIWNEKLGEEVAKHFRKGCRVVVFGEQDVQTWEQDGKDRYQVRVSAEVVALIPYRIESIVFREKRSDQSTQQDRAAA